MIRELMEEARTRGIIVQGFGSATARRESAQVAAFGPRVVRAVAPGRREAEIDGIPVDQSVADAVAASGARISVVYVPSDGAVDAALEAESAGVRLVVLVAEGVPLHALARAREALRGSASVVLGPASLGLVIPGVGRLRPMGGPDHASRFRPGAVGIVSRSGGLTAEIGMHASQWGWGTSVQLSSGSSSLLLTDLSEMVDAVARDPCTRVTVVVGEPAGAHELSVAEAYRDGAIPGPIVALMPGRAVGAFPSSAAFGHASRAGSETGPGIATKIDALEAAGITVVSDTSGLHEHLTHVLGPSKEKGGRSQ